MNSGVIRRPLITTLEEASIPKSSGQFHRPLLLRWSAECLQGAIGHKTAKIMA